MKPSLFWDLLVVASISGCASHGVMVSDQQAQQFQKGKSTEAEVVAVLGQPTTTVTRGGSRTLMYSGAQAQARPASFIPIIGPLVGGSDVRASSVMFQFGPDGRLVDVVSTQHSSGTGTGFAAGAPIAQTPDQPRKPPDLDSTRLSAAPSTSPADTQPTATQSPSKLGVQIAPVTAQLASVLRLPSTRGALVRFVEPDSIAGKIDIRGGDVILMVGDREIVNFSDLPGVVSSIPRGTEVQIKIVRTSTGKFEPTTINAKF